MIARYTRPAMAAIWSEQRKYENWLRVEIAATTALARAGVVPSSAVEALQQRASFTIERIHQIEAETAMTSSPSRRPWPSPLEPTRAGCTTASPPPMSSTRHRV